MAVELITGTPGAGKTTFAVATRLVQEAKRTVTLDNDTCIKLGLDLGTTVQRRIVVAGVRGLKVEHERLPHLLTRDVTPPSEVAGWNAMVQEKDETTGKMVDSDIPVHQRLPGEHPKDVPAIMQNWWLWCKPGDLIFIDEAQFVMPRATLGRKPPYWLQAMEIHRHYGVDFIFITQHPQLIDTTVRALVGLHRHVRSVMGSPVCMVYTWDHAANPERFNLANKSTFVRRRKHYALFHSAAAHVAPPTSGRSILVVVPLLVLGGVLGFMHFKKRFEPVGVSQAKAAEPSAYVPTVAVKGQAAPSALAPRTPRPPGYIDVPEVQGCYSVGNDCRCIGVDRRPVHVDLGMCKLSSSSYDGLVRWAPALPQPEQAKPVQGPASSALPKLI